MLFCILDKCVHFVQYAKYHNLGHSGPISLIFVARMIISYVLIRVMMTRNVLGWILGVKTLKNHQKLVGENLYTLFSMKNAII